MIEVYLLDFVLVLVLLAYLTEGWRSGFVRSIAAIVGLVAGGIVAFFAVPFVAGIIPSPIWRLFVTIALAIALFTLGTIGGATLGRVIRGRRRALGTVDRLLGAIAGVVAAALMLSLIAGSVAALGVPGLTKAIANSTVLGVIHNVTPAPIETGIARLRAGVLERGLPGIGGIIGSVQNPPAPPAAADTAALAAAGRSVVRISGTAYACGQNQSGSGFVIAPDRILTNAHVVAGVDSPVVEAPDGQTLDGVVVYFDPEKDLAVIATSGLSEPPLALSGALSPGANGVVDGYPFGGPFTSGGAQVLAVSDARIANIYGSREGLREIYTIAADVQPGNSGGPLLSVDGQVGGVVFARSVDQSNVGYAMTDTELQPIVTKAASLGTPVSAGACVSG